MTAQIGEVLLHGRKRMEMASCPPLPANHPRVVPVPFDKALADRATPEIVLSSACWRHYQGTWKVTRGRFYLVDLKGLFQLIPGEALHAEWFSGVIRVPQGELVEYNHMGFASVYARELHFAVDNGLVVSERTVDNQGRHQDRRELGAPQLPGCGSTLQLLDEL